MTTLLCYRLLAPTLTEDAIGAAMALWEGTWLHWAAGGWYCYARAEGDLPGFIGAQEVAWERVRSFEGKKNATW